jgi:hypothetical protein
VRIVLISLLAALAVAACGRSQETVRGFVVAPEGEPVRLCSLLLESYPPQCGDALYVVEGLDLSSVPELVSTDDPSLAQVSWTESEVELTGTVDGGVLHVG